MAIKHLKINKLRNIASLEISCADAVNVICGPNGSGKTSILEAIAMLSTGKSFRSHLKSRVIQYDQSSLVLFARVKLAGKEIPVGMEKSLSDETRLRMAGEDVLSISALADILPVQLLHPHSYELLEGGSKLRRQFIDWGVFHVEHLFYAFWQNAQRILKQRNAALKQRANIEEIQMWDEDLVSIATTLDEMRANYVEQLTPLFEALLAEITTLPPLTLHYYPGWNRDLGLKAQLERRVMQDRDLGYTVSGPHRADLKLSIDGVPVQDALSRGQQKLLVFALRFAQAQLLQQQTETKRTVFLIDDLPSELDANHQARLFDLITRFAEQQNQFFLTGVSQDSFQVLTDATLFHVEHGALKSNQPAEVF